MLTLPHSSREVALSLLDNRLLRMTEEEYLKFDRAAEYKSEFVAGEMYAMSGGRLRHADLASLLLIELHGQLKGRTCRVFNSDVRVRTPKSASYFYPDLSVVCGEPQTFKDSDDILVSPIVLVEVLSPSTADYDHGTKFAHYREIPTLEEYILVHTDAILIEQYTRQNSGNWLLSEHEGMEAELSLPSIDCSINLRAIYEDAIA